MLTLPIVREKNQTWQGTAKILGCEGTMCRIHCWIHTSSDANAPSTPCDARRAVSCLVQPQVGDRVWVVEENKEFFVTAILERENPDLPIEVQAEGDIVIRSKTGEISMEGRSLALQSEQIKIHASEAQLTLARLIHVGQSVVSYVNTIKYVVKSMESVAERCFARFKRSYRHVEEIEQVRAGEIDLRAQSNFQARAKNTFVTAESLVKVDGGQIHLG